MLSSSEIASLISALGCGYIAKDGEMKDFDIKNLRYGKIIIMTDADVDGAHIRTLLLTLFQNKMEPLFENGHIYIAQPPLYKIKKGKAEKYLNNDEELSEFINSDIVANNIFRVDDKPLTKDKFLKLLEDFSKMKTLLTLFPRKRDKMLLEHLAFFRPVTTELLSKKKELGTWANDFESFINKCTPINIGFEVNVSEDESEKGSFKIEVNKVQNGVERELEPLHKHFFSADSYLRLSLLGLSSFSDSTFAYTDNNDNLHQPSNLSDALGDLLAKSREGLTLQRYKGLGEMNPSQLEETTMNVKTRSLLRVLPLDGAKNIISELMGEDPEPRKIFIKSNAPDVKNLDI